MIPTKTINAFNIQQASNHPTPREMYFQHTAQGSKYTK